MGEKNDISEEMLVTLQKYMETLRRTESAENKNVIDKKPSNDSKVNDEQQKVPQENEKKEKVTSKKTTCKKATRKKTLKTSSSQLPQKASKQKISMAKLKKSKKISPGDINSALSIPSTRGKDAAGHPLNYMVMMCGQVAALGNSMKKLFKRKRTTVRVSKQSIDSVKKVSKIKNSTTKVAKPKIVQRCKISKGSGSEIKVLKKQSSQFGRVVSGESGNFSQGKYIPATDLLQCSKESSYASFAKDNNSTLAGSCGSSFVEENNEEDNFEEKFFQLYCNSEKYSGEENNESSCEDCSGEDSGNEEDFDDECNFECEEFDDFCSRISASECELEFGDFLDNRKRNNGECELDLGNLLDNHKSNNGASLLDFENWLNNHKGNNGGCEPVFENRLNNHKGRKGFAEKRNFSSNSFNQFCKHNGHAESELTPTNSLPNMMQDEISPNKEYVPPLELNFFVFLFNLTGCKRNNETLASESSYMIC